MDSIQEAEQILHKSGIINIKCYIDGIDKWKKIGGKIQYPRFIKFEVFTNNHEIII